MGNNLPTVDLGTGKAAASVTGGEGHTCALLVGGDIKCWGRNNWGQLGQGHTNQLGDGPGEMGDNLPTVDLGTGTTAIAIEAGEHHTCAILNDGSLKCWGKNNASQLGHSSSNHLGDASGEMGDNLPVVDLGTGRTATAVSAGGMYTCALLDNGNVKCWGNGGHGQLGQGNAWTIGSEPNSMGDNLPAIDLGGAYTATAIAAEAQTTCAVLNDGNIKCWGHNDEGQLGQECGPDGNIKCWDLEEVESTSLGSNPGEMGNDLPPIDLGTSSTVTAVSTGRHTCALLNGGSLKCWGRGRDGQLGNGVNTGDSALVGDGLGEMGNNLPLVDFGTGKNVVQIVTGVYHSCALLNDATVKCWGWNGYGQLGGYVGDAGDGPGEMGDNLPIVDLGS